MSLAVIVLALAGGSTALASEITHGSQHARVARSQGKHTSGHRAPAIAAVLRRHFAVFRSKAHASKVARLGAHKIALAAKQQALPRSVAQKLSATSGYQVDPSEAGAIPGPNNSTLWIVPGQTGTCLELRQPTAEDPSGASLADACDGIQTPYGADSGRFFMITGVPDSASVTVSGLVPDGNATVQIDTASGQQIAVPVVDNVYSVNVVGPTALVAKAADGDSVTAAITAPSSAAPG